MSEDNICLFPQVPSECQDMIGNKIQSEKQTLGPAFVPVLALQHFQFVLDCLWLRRVNWLGELRTKRKPTGRRVGVGGNWLLRAGPRHKWLFCVCVKIF